MALRFKIGDKVILARSTASGEWCGLYSIFELARTKNTLVKGIVEHLPGSSGGRYRVRVSGLKHLGPDWDRSSDSYLWSMFDEMLDPDFVDFKGGVRYRVVMPNYSVMRSLDPKMAVADRVAALVGHLANDLDYNTNRSMITGRIKSSGEVFTLMEV